MCHSVSSVLQSAHVCAQGAGFILHYCIRSQTTAMPTALPSGSDILRQICETVSQIFDVAIYRSPTHTISPIFNPIVMTYSPTSAAPTTTPSQPASLRDRIDMCVGMCTDTHVDTHVVEHGPWHRSLIGVCIDMYIGTRMGMCIDMCIGMCTGMCQGMCTGMHTHMGTGMCIDMRVDMCIDICHGITTVVEVSWTEFWPRRIQLCRSWRRDFAVGLCPIMHSLNLMQTAGHATARTC